VYSVLIATPLLSLVAWGLIRFDCFGYGALPGWSALLMAPEVAAISFVMLLQMWRIRRQQFRSLALGHATLGLSRAGAQVSTGGLGMGFVGLAVSDTLSRVAVVLVLTKGILPDIRSALQRNRREIATLAWRYRNFPFFRTPSTFANNVGTAMPPSLIAMAYGVPSAGLYTLMWSVIVAPGGLIQKAVGDVFIGHFAERFRTDRTAARRFLLRIALALSLISIGPGIALWFWGGPGFAILFGEAWRPAGRLASRMVPLLMADLVIGPLGGSLNVANRPDAKLYFDATRLGGYAAAYFIATRSHAPLEGMVSLFAGFGVLCYALYAVLIYFGTRHPRAVVDLRVDPRAISG
jgi:O-antigen/teichoic acid export membrane protein